MNASNKSALVAVVAGVPKSIVLVKRPAAESVWSGANAAPSILSLIHI